MDTGTLRAQILAGARVKAVNAPGHPAGARSLFNLYSLNTGSRLLVTLEWRDLPRGRMCFWNPRTGELRNAWNGYVGNRGESQCVCAHRKRPCWRSSGEELLLRLHCPPLDAAMASHAGSPFWYGWTIAHSEDQDVLIPARSGTLYPAEFEVKLRNRGKDRNPCFFAKRLPFNLIWEFYRNIFRCLVLYSSERRLPVGRRQICFYCLKCKSKQKCGCQRLMRKNGANAVKGKMQSLLLHCFEDPPRTRNRS
jgi:hypothetical protein